MMRACHKYVANVFYACDEATVSCTHRRRLAMAGNANEHRPQFIETKGTAGAQIGEGFWKDGWQQQPPLV
jgi:hypothetical protein